MAKATEPTVPIAGGSAWWRQLAAAAVIGCGEDEETPADTATPGPAGTTAAEQPRCGGILATLNEGTEGLPHLDVHQNSFGVLHVSGPGITYSRLVMYDLSKWPQEIAFTGDLAESWENPDPTTYVFKLRRGVKFHNTPPVNAREFKASDIVYSYQRQKEQGSNAGIIAALDRIEAVDDYTVRITTRRPDADFLYAVGDQRSKVVAKEAVDLNGDLKNGPTIGTGPWIFEEWVPE